MNNSFEIKSVNNGIIVEKNELSFSIEKGPDGDIWFNSVNNMKFPIALYTRNQEEWESYFMFENLMKSIIGRYFLSGEYKNELSRLPKDFIDLENKTITWRSDSNHDNLLQLKLCENEIILSFSRDKKTKNKYLNDFIPVRIRTSGSDYGHYYQEFERFYVEFSRFAYAVESNKKQDSSNNDIKPPSRKRSLFDKLKK